MNLTQARPVDYEIFETKKRVVRILIANDHSIVRYGLRKLLGLETDLDVVGEACNSHEVLERVHQLIPDILLLDLRMPNLDGMSTLETLQRSGQQTQVIVSTSLEDLDEFVRAIRLGCRGILLNRSAPELIIRSIRKVKAGEIWLDPQISEAVLNHSAEEPIINGAAEINRDRNPLSARERKIVALIAQGYKNKEMAEKMFISERTVKNHLHNIFDKLNVTHRLELALYAIHKGIHLNGSSSPVPKTLPSAPRPC